MNVAFPPGMEDGHGVIEEVTFSQHDESGVIFDIEIRYKPIVRKVEPSTEVE